MIDYYFWTTPNGYKGLLFLEETGIPYRINPVNIGKGEQFDPSFLAISPNNKIPAMIDHDPIVSDQPVTLFESGAILLYLAQKTGRFLPNNIQQRAEMLQWLFWQMSSLGPFSGQSLHFQQYAPEAFPYSIRRYHDETSRLFKVLDKQLSHNEYLAGEYSIADMATYPWIAIHERLNQDLNNYPAIERWLKQIEARPATQRAYQKGKEINQQPTMTNASKKILLGQSAETVPA